MRDQALRFPEDGASGYTGMGAERGRYVRHCALKVKDVGEFSFKWNARKSPQTGGVALLRACLVRPGSSAVSRGRALATPHRSVIVAVPPVNWTAGLARL